MSLNALVPNTIGDQQLIAAKAVSGVGFQLGSTDYAGLCNTSKYDILVGTATLATGFKTFAVTSVLGNTPNGGGAGVVGIPAARNAGCIFEGWLGSTQNAAVAAAAPALQGAQFNGRLVIAGVAPAETNTLTIAATAVDGSIVNTSTALVGYRIYVPKEGFY
jgi:hypothetical protein